MNKFFDRKTVIIIAGFAIIPLLILLIIVASAKISNQSEIVTTISTSVGLTSLILAFIAIIQNIVSGNPVETVLKRVEQASNDVLSSSQELSKSTSLLNRAAEDVSAKIDLVPKTMEVVSSKMDETLARFAQNQADKGDDDGGRDEEDDGNAPKRTTNGGVIACYIAAQSFVNSKLFDPKIIFKTRYMIGYIDGYISALQAAGQLERTRAETGETIVTRLTGFTPEQARLAIEESQNPEFVKKFTQKIDDWVAGKQEDSVTDAADAAP